MKNNNKEIITFPEYFNLWAEDHNFKGTKPPKFTLKWLKISYYGCIKVAIPLGLKPIHVDLIGTLIAFIPMILFSLFKYIQNGYIIYILSLFILLSFLLAAIIDNIDGGVARIMGNNNSEGGFQDLIFDRIIDGLLLISPIFSGYTNGIIIISTLILVYSFETLRSIHVSIGIPMKGTLAERHIRFLIISLYIWIFSFIYLIANIFKITDISIFFWPNLNILYLILSGLCIFSLIHLFISIWHEYPAKNIFHHSTLQSSVNEQKNKIKNKEKNEKEIQIFYSKIHAFIDEAFLFRIADRNPKFYYKHSLFLFKIFRTSKRFLIFSLFSIMLGSFLLNLYYDAIDSLNLSYTILILISIIFLFYFQISVITKYLGVSSICGYITLRGLIIAEKYDFFVKNYLIFLLFLLMEINYSYLPIILLLFLINIDSINLINRRFKNEDPNCYFSQLNFNLITYSIIACILIVDIPIFQNFVNILIIIIIIYLTFQLFKIIIKSNNYFKNK